jgi:anti-sigma regulatory factor (Ser/Thr protein kinase)
VSANARYDTLTTQVDPPGRLMLYTDGLMERAGESLDDGLERLRRSVPDEARPAGELCDLVVQALLPEGTEHDDAALLVMSTEPLGDPLVVTLPAEPDSPPILRRILRRWLADHGAGSQETDELILACAEACANAIEHAYPPEPRPFRVEGRYENGNVTFTVRDWGQWRPPRGEHRGRGLVLMEGLADSVRVDPSDEGTTVTLSRRLLEAQRA